MKPYFVKSAIIGFFVIVAVFPVAAADWNHDPKSLIGPLFWGDLDPGFATCAKGIQQSPIDISNTVPDRVPALKTKYRATALEVENNGHAIEVPYPPGSTLKVNREVFELLQFHFHAPSEHTVNGKFADIEAHLVHLNPSTMQIAVIGVLMNVGPNPNPLVDIIFENAPDEEGTAHVDEEFVNAINILPLSNNATGRGRVKERRDKAGAKLRNYYTYPGSLTTPPCSEGVRWFVLKDSVNISQFAVDRLHALVAKFPAYSPPINTRVWEDNNRPILPIHDRVIIDSYKQ